ncbi:MAG: hypothetical protein EZS28_037356 [Streblomastix strix]|uniref:Uncharacterized protein n=1 Tax=Streblomastix strix TaxID=222440 RepID=A0A5J4U956_9EUKA|nr:MAG: hypothetical protein EZS28_037356 [Streblomastix strix]
MKLVDNSLYRQQVIQLINLQQSNILISALSFHALQPTISIIPLVRSFSSLGNSLLTSISPRVGIHILGGPEVRQGDMEITNHYSVSKRDEDNNWLPLLSLSHLFIEIPTMSFALIEDAKIQYCKTLREFQE